MSTEGGSAGPSLDERIAAALTGEHSSAALAALLAEAAAAAESAQADAAAATERALDPATPPAEVDKARAAMSDAQFRRDRLGVATHRLEELRVRAVARERDKENQERITAAIAQRDALVKELKQVYPAVAAQLAELFERLSVNNHFMKEVAQLGARDTRRAEDVAREDGTPFLANQPDLVANVKLPGFFRLDAGRYLWPRGGNIF